MYRRYFIALFVVFAVVASIVFLRVASDAPSFKVGSITHALPMKDIRIGILPLQVEVASTDAEHEQGLSGRGAIQDGSGMLFIFHKSEMYGIWMKDMNFPIDIIWIDESGVVVAIDKNISPDTYPTPFYPPSPIRFVLEVSAGFSDAHQVTEGTVISGL